MTAISSDADPEYLPERKQGTDLAGTAPGYINTDAASNDLKNAVRAVLARFPRNNDPERLRISI
jgi:hypothetical protein